MSGSLRRDVFVADLGAPHPVFHRVPDWHAGEGCVGPYRTSNINRFTGAGVQLPDRVRAACGQNYLVLLVSGTDPDRRPDVELHDPYLDERARMHFPHPLGGVLPRRHAEAFARPCGRCFPKPKAASQPD